MEFDYRTEVFDFRGAVCFRPSPAGETGVGHYTAVCQRNGTLVLFDDSSSRFDQDEIYDWLQLSRLLVYSSNDLKAFLRNIFIFD